MVWPARTVTVAVPQVSAPVVANADRLGHVVTNSLKNAFTYSPAEGPVAVRLTVDGQEARVEVRDHGPGLAPEVHERIWQRFQRASPTMAQSAAGLGLGVSISRSILERHGATGGLESQVGAGATVVLTLPLTHTTSLDTAGGAGE